MSTRLAHAVVALLAVMSLSSCAGIMLALRQDLDEGENYGGPTTGGSWTERSMFSQGNEDGRRGGGNENAREGRRPAAVASSGRQVSEPSDGEEGGEEDGSQDGPAYSNTPALEPPMRRLYKNGSRATRADFVDESQGDGSLWAGDGQTNFFFIKNKVRGVGDILTITVEAELVRDIRHEVTRTLSPVEREMEIALAQERIRLKTLGLEDPNEKNKDAVASSSASAARTPAAGAAAKGKSVNVIEEDIVIPKATSADIDVGKSLDAKEGDTMMAEIVERYPNGNYKVRGVKKLRYKNSVRMLNLVGIVKSTDVTEQDTMTSGKIYEYRLEVLR